METNSVQEIQTKVRSLYLRRLVFAPCVGSSECLPVKELIEDIITQNFEDGPWG
jgi:hypothetical protein